MSHSHGWASGPAAALTFYTLGIRPAPSTPTIDGGQFDAVVRGMDYLVAPQPGDLQWCSGSLSFAESEHTKCGAGMGVVRVRWNQINDSFDLDVDPLGFSGSKGAVVVPLRRSFGTTNTQQQACEVRVNDAVAWTLRDGVNTGTDTAGARLMVWRGNDGQHRHAAILSGVEAEALIAPLNVKVVFCQNDTQDLWL